MQPEIQKNQLNVSKTVVVVGAGATGMGCALTVAMSGLKVILVEKTRKPGGTVRQALIHTIGGLFDDQGELINQGLSAELTERLIQTSPQTKKRRIGKTWVLDVDPEHYTQVVTEWLATTTGISARYQTEITHIAAQNTYINEVTIHGNNDQTLTLQPRALVDATGNANIVRLIDATLVDKGMALGVLYFILAQY